ncbi:MAG: hypothetical protein ACR2PG_21445 [Hyphomicrobiaceae bacterium]
MSSTPKTFDEWKTLAQRDDCLTKMAPGDFELALDSAVEAEREACAAACDNMAAKSQAIGTQRAVVAALKTAARKLRER